MPPAPAGGVSLSFPRKRESRREYFICLNP